MPISSTCLPLAPVLQDPLQCDIAGWFQSKGTEALIAEDRNKEAPYDYLAFIREARILPRTMIPASLESKESQWDPATVFATSENLAFHGFMNWLMWHVTFLGTLPVWMCDNPTVQRRYCDALEWGLPSAYGMSEKAAGADWRHTTTKLHRNNGSLVLNGEKNYAGNAQFSPIVTTFVRDCRADSDDFAFVAVSAGNPGFHKRKNAVPEQMYVCDFSLDNYPVDPSEIIQSGPQAFADAVNTINIGKVNLATAALGLHCRMTMETYGHLRSRSIFGRPTSEFGQNRQNVAVAALRSKIMRSFLEVCQKAMSHASQNDQRYVVFNAIAKVLVTEMAELSIIDMTDAASALTFEENSPIYSIRNYVGYLPRLEGTKYVNIMQATKAMGAYFSSTNISPSYSNPGETGAGYLLSPRELGGFKNTFFGSWKEKLVQIDGFAGYRHPFETISLIADWAVKNPPAVANGDERLIQAIGEVFFQAVAICEIAAHSKDELLEPIIGLLATELAATIIHRKRELDRTGLPTQDVVSALSQIDWEFPEDVLIDQLDKEAERMSASLHTAKSRGE